MSAKKETNMNTIESNINAVNPEIEKRSFQTEVTQLLHLVTHSLYSNKEIFLRELISNSSDAADKLRFEALSNPALYENDSTLRITVSYDKKARTITVRDNGIGMNRDEVVTNLGTIAKSGTKEFLAKLAADKKNQDVNLIGQFGVGFYSSFVVAEKVTVKTRRAGTPTTHGVYWESTADGAYLVKNIEQSWRGTEVTLYLKEDVDEFLDDWRLRNIITKYSDHILLPIYMPKSVADATTDTGATAATTAEEQSVTSAEKAVEETKEAREAQEVEEIVNRATALWTLPKKDIKDEEYKELYKHITHDFGEPLLWSHNMVEGKIEYITLLYIPERAPFDLWHRDHRHGLKLYVQRVFIMDNAEHLLPNYLRFVRGIVDSKDLPLNVSREILQSNKTIDSMRSGIIKRVLDMLEKLVKDESDKYAQFWQAFGQVMKEGIIEDFAHKDRIAKLLRFTSSTHCDDKTPSVSLDDYVSRMASGQDKIYYITAETLNAAKNSPHLEIFKKKNIEVLLLIDRIDEWMLSGLTEYAGKELQSVAKGTVDLSKISTSKGSKEDKESKEKDQDSTSTTAAKDTEDKAKETSEAGQNDDKSKDDSEEDKNTEIFATEFAEVIKKMQKELGEQVKTVRISSRLTDSPACLVTDEDDISMHLQRMMAAAGQKIPHGKPTLEINPQHPLITQLKNLTDDAEQTHQFAEWTHLLFEQAFLAEGGHLDDPASFVKRLNVLLLEKTRKAR